MILFRRIRAVFILFFVFIFILNIFSLFMPGLAYSPMKSLLPVSNIGFFKENVVSGYMYSDISVTGSGPAIKKLKVTDETLGLRGYIEPDFKRTKGYRPYLLINIESLYELLSHKNKALDIKTLNKTKKIYGSDRMALRLYGDGVSKIKINGIDFMKIGANKKDRFARFVVDGDNGVDVYDFVKDSSVNGILQLKTQSPKDLNFLNDDFSLAYVSKTVKLADSYKRDLVYPRDYGINATTPYLEAERDIVEDFRKLSDAGKSQGHDLLVVSGYRSFEKQKELHEARIRELESQGYAGSDAVDQATKEVLPPGYSEHMTARAVDTVTLKDSSLDGFVSSEAAKWIGENSYKYGFVVRYPEGKTATTQIIFEPWHLRYLGAPYAGYLKSNNLVFDDLFLSSQKGMVVSDGTKDVYLSVKAPNSNAKAYCNTSTGFKKYVVTDNLTGYEIPLD